VFTRLNRRAAAGAAVALLAAVTITAGNLPASADTASVSINGFAFMPASVSVTAGSTVTWTQNQSGVMHTVTADNGSFDSGALATGRTFSMTFSTAGTFAYHCSIHPSMHGTVTVTAAAAPAGNSGSTAATPSSSGNTGGGSPANAAPSGGRSASLSAGYNLVGPPGGTSFGDSTAFAFDPQSNMYVQLGAGEQTQAGQGYWLLSDNGGSMALGAGSTAPASFMAAPGAWQLVGDPSGTEAALVSGADAVWTYDPASGQYQPATMLQPGQGAWAMSQAGGKITITPGGQAATATPSPTPSPAPQPTQQPQTQPTQQPTPQPVQPTMQPYIPPRYGPGIVSPMMPMPMPRPMPMPY